MFTLTLTMVDDQGLTLPVVVNRDAIDYFHKALSGSTRIVLRGGYDLYVTETPEEVNYRLIDIKPDRSYKYTPKGQGDKA